MNTSAPLTRLVYVSQATFKPFHTPEGMECHVAEILAISRKNNQQKNLVGALYYGSGNFFQCLEGEKTTVETLYDKLKNDTRHHRLTILHQEPIEQLGFPDWDMKYAMIDQQARDFIKLHSLRKFDPYQFSPAMTQQFVQIMLQTSQDVPSDILQHAIDTPIPAAKPLTPLHYVVMAILLIIVVFAAISLSSV